MRRETVAPRLPRQRRAGIHYANLFLYFAAMAIFFSGFWASAPLGSLIVNTPFSKLAWILSSSIPSGSWKER